MKADLHFHPSFFSYGDKPHITERNYPTLEQIVKTAFQKCMDILTVTSCSSKDSIDRRWDNYINDLKNFNEIKPNIFSENCVRFDCNLDFGTDTIYLFHGQEFKTHLGDINVLFGEKKVPIKKSKGDFYYLIDSARDSGENVMILLPHPARSGLNKNEIRKLYSSEKIDAIESYDAMDTELSNKKSKKLSCELGIPGIAVSDGHRLEDLGKSCISFYSDSSIDSYKDVEKLIKNKIRVKEFTNIEESLPLPSKILYVLRLINARFFHNF